MAKAKQLPSGNWRAQYYKGKKADGKNEYGSITKPTEAETNYFAEQSEKHYKDINQDASNMTLTEAIDKYIESKSNLLSPVTVRGYKVIQRNRFKLLMPVKLNKLSRQKIMEAINSDAASVSHKTLKNSYGLLLTVVNEYAFGLSFGKITFPQKKPFEANVLDETQIADLLTTVSGTDAEVPILLAVWLGLRRSEICGLKWDCIDFEKSTIKIKAALVPNSDNKFVLKSPKSYTSYRTIKTSSYLMDKINTLSRDNEYVIGLDPNQVYKRFKKALKACGLPDNIRLHDLRHTNASVMLALNIADKYAMERGGWSTANMYKNKYGHTFTKEREAVDDKVNVYYESVVSHEISHDDK